VSLQRAKNYDLSSLHLATPLKSDKINGKSLRDRSFEFSDTTPSVTAQHRGQSVEVNGRRLSMRHSMTVWTDRPQILDRVNG
jgi:hypothetical protein